MENHKESSEKVFIVHGVKFTLREFDVLSCIFGGRTAKKIGILLSLSPKTVENYIHNIKVKVGCNTQESIRDFLEKSDKIDALRKHYAAIAFKTTAEEGQNFRPTSPVQQDISEGRWGQLPTLFKGGKGSLALLGAMFLFLSYVGLSPFLKKVSEDSIQRSSVVRSDLLIPAESALLNRVQLISSIGKKLKGTQGIQMIALVGIGGAGKTTLARQYAQDHRASVIWELNAETRNSLLRSFEDLANALARTQKEKEEIAEIQGIEKLDLRESKLMLFLKTILRGNSDWLLIYDNVDSLADIKDLFPYDSHKWGNGHVILTTRDANIGHNRHMDAENIILIDALSDSEKLDLFNTICDHRQGTAVSASQDTQKIQFLKDIPPFPLDVIVAAHYLQESKISYASYLHLLSKQDSAFAKTQETLLKDMSDYTKSRYRIIILSLQKLMEKNPDYRDLLVFISLLDSQDIPRNLLVHYKNASVVDALVHDLKTNSLIFVKEHTANSKEPDTQISPTFSIHRSTQQIFYNHFLTTLGLKEKDPLLESIDKATGTYVTDTTHGADFSEMRAMAAHIATILSHKEFLNDQVVASIEHELGQLYFCIWDYKKSKQLLERSLEILGTNEGKNHEKIVLSHLHLGDIYRTLGDNEKALIHLKKALNTAEHYYGGNHPYAAWANILMGDVYRESGELPLAQEITEKGVAIYRQAGAKYTKRIGWGLTYLGDVYRFAGNYPKAKEVFEEAAVICKEHYGEEHPRTVWARMYLGVVHMNLGNYKLAKELLEKNIQLHEKNLGKNHFELAWALIRLGAIHQHFKDHDKALEALNRSLELRKNYFGEDHIKTFGVLAYLGSLYTDMGKHEEAKDMLIKTLAAHEKYYGKGHIQYAWVLAKLAHVHKNMGDYKQAQLLLTQSLSVYEENYGKEHVETASILRDLGEVYLLQGNKEHASTTLKKSFEIFQANQHPEQHTLVKYLSKIS